MSRIPPLHTLTNAAASAYARHARLMAFAHARPAEPAARVIHDALAREAAAAL